MTMPVDEVKCNVTYFSFLYIIINIRASNMSLVK